MHTENCTKRKYLLQYPTKEKKKKTKKVFKSKKF